VWDCARFQALCVASSFSRFQTLSTPAHLRITQAVGIKMVIVDFYKIPVGVSLTVIAGILAVSIAASLWKTKMDGQKIAEAGTAE